MRRNWNKIVCECFNEWDKRPMNGSGVALRLKPSNCEIARTATGYNMIGWELGLSL